MRVRASLFSHGGAALLLMTTVSACQPADDEAAAGSTLTDVGPATGGEGGAGEGGAQAAGGLGGTLPDPDQGVAGGGRPAPDATTGPGGADASTDAAPAPDTDARTAPTPDGGPGPESDAGVPPPVCPERALPAIDGPRVVLVGHPFADAMGGRGTDIHGLTLTPEGELVDDGVRFDVGFRVARIAFAPHGQHAFVLGGDGELASVSVGAADALALIDVVALPGADYGDVEVSADASTLWVTGSNVNETSGISTVRVDCDGGLTVDEAAFFNLRLSDSAAFLPGQQRALVLGGQAVFDPIDDRDVRLLERVGDAAGEGFREVGAFDLYHDFVGAGRIAVSPDGRLGAIPNNSVFSEEGGQVMIVAIEGDVVTEVERVLEVEDPGEALFSLDGQTLVVSQVEPGRLTVLRIEDGRVADRGSVRGIGLADQMARVERGPLADTLLIPSIDPNGGPNISMVRITGPGMVVDLGETPLGDGIEQIVTPIAVQP
jgi:hypothetical protein